MPIALDPSFVGAINQAVNTPHITSDMMRSMRNAAQANFFRYLQSALTMPPSEGYGINWDNIRPPFSSYNLPKLHGRNRDAKGQLKLEYR